MSPRPRLALVPLESRRAWEETRVSFPLATAFHGYDFLSAVAPALGCEFVPLAVTSRGERAGLAPLLVKRLGPLATINWTPFPYLGPLVPGALMPATLSALRAQGRRRRAVNHQQSLPALMTQPPAGGFTACTDRTFIASLDGRPDRVLLAAMQRKRREEVHRAERAGFTVGSASARDIARADGWLSQRHTQWGLADPYRAGLCRRVFDRLGDSTRAGFHAAAYQGSTVGVVITLTAGRSAFGWQLAVNPSFQAGNLRSLLVWHALRWARDAGLREFDMLGAPTEGIAAYKGRFGATERRYTVLRRQARAHRVAMSVSSLRPSARQRR